MKKLFAFLFALFFAASALGAFVSGPVVLDELPQNLAKPSGTLPVRLLNEKKFPQELLGAVNGLISSGKSVLIVGNTDTMGPKLLNRSLGLQYAINAAQKLSAELKIERARFYCASAGELAAKTESVLEIFPYNPPPPAPQGPKSAAMVIEPMPDERLSNKVTFIRASDARNILFATEGEEGLTVWEAESTDVLVAYEFGAKEGQLPFGGTFRGENFTRTARFDKTPETPGLSLKIEAVESGYARISGKAPTGIPRVTVWAGPFPYPADVENGKFEIYAALLPYPVKAYSQGIDQKGNKSVGPSIEIPADTGEPPALIAVLFWEGAKADLDLHGWRRSGHTQPQDADPTVSPTAAEGVKILFDGEGGRRSSALTAKDPSKLEIEVRCFSDFGDGANAFLYLLENPGDKLSRTGKIIGPRKILGEGSRWFALKP